jgi:hypothetical protein
MQDVVLLEMNLTDSSSEEDRLAARSHTAHHTRDGAFDAVFREARSGLDAAAVYRPMGALEWLNRDITGDAKFVAWCYPVQSEEPLRHFGSATGPDLTTPALSDGKLRMKILRVVLSVVAVLAVLSVIALFGMFATHR